MLVSPRIPPHIHATCSFPFSTCHLFTPQDNIQPSTPPLPTSSKERNQKAANNHHAKGKRHKRDIHTLTETMEKIRKQLSVVTYEDWYKVTTKDIRGAGGSLILKFFSDSTSLAITSIYPEHQWLLWKFSSVPHAWWAQKNNQKQYLDWLGLQLGYTKKEHWYSIKYTDLEKNRGRSLLRLYNDSASAAVSGVYSDDEHEWRGWCFNILPHGFWKSTENRKAYMSWLGQRFGVLPLNDPGHESSMEIWYRITVDNFYSNRGRTLLELYNNSPSQAIQSILNDHKWLPWRFHVLPKNFYVTDQVHVSELVEIIKKKMNIMDYSDWYRVSHNALAKEIGHGLLRRSGGLYELLARAYPDHEWDKERFEHSNKRALQKLLKEVVSQIFADCEVYEEYHHPQILSGETHETSALDVYIPSLQLAFEYHGGQHYADTPSYNFGSTSLRTILDLQKRVACQNAGIYLIEVPFWWNKERKSLEATIAKVRPDLIQPDLISSEPIPPFPYATKTRRKNTDDGSLQND